TSLCHSLVLLLFHGGRYHVVRQLQQLTSLQLNLALRLFNKKIANNTLGKKQPPKFIGTAFVKEIYSQRKATKKII
ncbi:MAG TPA: hypothetical protein VF610_02210, partial [Segetibacter sp.]